jgi:hypothetical protein
MTTISEGFPSLPGAGPGWTMDDVSTGPVTAYLRDVAGDPSVEILFWSPEEALLLDEAGRLHDLTKEHPAPRFTSWIRGSDGAQVALLTAGSASARDAASDAAVARLGALLAESSRRLAVLRRRVAEQHQTLAAARLDLDGLREAVPVGGRAAVERLEAALRLALSQVVGLARAGSPSDEHL